MNDCRYANKAKTKLHKVLVRKVKKTSQETGKRKEKEVASILDA